MNIVRSIPLHAAGPTTTAGRVSTGEHRACRLLSRMSCGGLLPCCGTNGVSAPRQQIATRAQVLTHPPTLASPYCRPATQVLAHCSGPRHPQADSRSNGKLAGAAAMMRGAGCRRCRLPPAQSMPAIAASPSPTHPPYSYPRCALSAFPLFKLKFIRLAVSHIGPLQLCCILLHHASSRALVQKGTAAASASLTNLSLPTLRGQPAPCLNL